MGHRKRLDGKAKALLDDGFHLFLKLVEPLLGLHVGADAGLPTESDLLDGRYNRPGMIPLLLSLHKPAVVLRHNHVKLPLQI